MARLAGKDITALLEFLKGLYSSQHIQGFRHQLVTSINTLVGSDVTSYNEVDPLSGRIITWVSDHPSVLAFPDSDRIFEQHLAEHPLIGHYAHQLGNDILKISDFLTKRQFHKLGLYAEYYRRVGVEHQMAFVLPARRPTVIGIALNRSLSDFSERDRLLLDLIRPHAVQAYRNAKAMTRISQNRGLDFSTLEDQNSAVLRISQDARVLATERARQLLKKYFPHYATTGSQLPDVLQEWIRQHEDSLRDTRLPSQLTPLVVEQGGNRLIVRLLPEADGFLLSLTERLSASGPEVFLCFGLTRREAEVLSWVAQGKTNAVIGDILGLSPRTVQKHLEHIFQRLGVETRTAAAAWALQITNPG